MWGRQQSANNNFSFGVCRGSDQYPGAWLDNRCAFENICLDRRTRKYVYFQDPNRDTPQFVFDQAFFGGGNNTTNHSTVGLRLDESRWWAEGDRHQIALPFQVEYHPIPKEVDFLDETPVTVLFATNYWAINFGHAVVDDILPIYVLLITFGLEFTPPDKVQVMTPYGLADTFYEYGSPSREQSEKVKSRIVNWELSFLRPFSSRTPINLSQHPRTKTYLNNDTLVTMGDNNYDHDDKDNNNKRYVCFRTMLVGHARLGLQYDYGRHIDPFVDRIVSYYGQDPSATTSPEDRKAILEPLVQPNICFVKKDGGRRSILNFDALTEHLKERFGSRDGNQVTIIDVESLGKDQAHHIATAHQCSVIITPWGGISFFALFARRDTPVVFTSYYDIRKNRSVNPEEEVLWRYQTRLVTFQYQVSKEEVVFHDGTNGANVQHTDHDRWRDGHQLDLNLTRFGDMVASAVETARHAFF